MNTKRCCRCKSEKELVEFNKDRTRTKDGHSPECRECAKTYKNGLRKIGYFKAYNQANKAKRKLYNDALKARKKDLIIKSKAIPCVDCGDDFHHCQMDFHHVDPSTKTKDVALMIHNQSSMNQLIREIEKCVVICSNCHRLREYKIKHP